MRIKTCDREGEREMELAKAGKRELNVGRDGRVLGLAG
jgi:hypothetical protein